MKHLSKILFILLICIGLKANAANAHLPKIYDVKGHVEATIAAMPIQDVNNAEKVDSPSLANNYKNDLNPTKRLFKKPTVSVIELKEFYLFQSNAQTVGYNQVFIVCKDIPVLFKKLII